MLARSCLAGLGLALCVVVPAAQAALVRVPAGDCGALERAVYLHADTDTEVLLAPGANYSNCATAVQVQGSVRIDAGGAYLGTFTLDRGTRLTLRNARFVWPVPAATAAPGQASPQPKFVEVARPLITNDGVLTLESTTVSGWSYGSRPGVVGSPLVLNARTLILRNVTFAANPSSGGFPLILNLGELDVVQSTLTTTQEPAKDGSLISSSGAVRIVNSVLTAQGGALCYGAIQSQGGNVATDGSCGLGAGDRVVADVGLVPLADRGGLVPTLQLLPGSPARRAGVAGACEALDARGETRAAACDAGAFEYGGGAGRLTRAGINGSYYNPASDGHYVMIQRITDALALVTWNTFDATGKPAWIYGVCEVSGSRIHVAQAARNVGGRLQPGGVPTGQQVEAWGQFDVQLDGCNTGRFDYASTAPGFGAGGFALSRLVALDGVGCKE